MKNEIWKDIEGYEGLYQVSDQGRVKSLDHTNIQLVGKHICKVTHKGKFLKPRIHSNGYFEVQLGKNGKFKNFYMHRLVAKAFLPESEHTEVDHINCIKTDNRAENLRFCDRKMNMRNPITYNIIKEHCSQLGKTWGPINGKKTIQNNRKQWV